MRPNSFRFALLPLLVGANLACPSFANESRHFAPASAGILDHLEMRQREDQVQMTAADEKSVTARKLLQVDAVSVGKSAGGDLEVCIDATASTPGYTNVTIERVPNAEGPRTIAFSLMGDPPQDLVAQVLTPVSLRIALQEMPTEAEEIQVLAETNSMSASLPKAAAPCAIKTAVAPADPLAGTWLVEDIGGRGVIDNLQSTVTFDATKVYVAGGCNRFRGAAKIEDQSLTFGPLAGTKMSCAPAVNDQENKLLSAWKQFVTTGLAKPFWSCLMTAKLRSCA